MLIDDICRYIQMAKTDARSKGQTSITLRSGDVHKDLHLCQRMPSVCSAMYRCMEKDDVILHTTASGYSSTIEIRYYL